MLTLGSVLRNTKYIFMVLPMICKSIYQQHQPRYQIKPCRTVKEWMDLTLSLNERKTDITIFSSPDGLVRFDSALGLLMSSSCPLVKNLGVIFLTVMNYVQLDVEMGNVGVKTINVKDLLG